MPEYKTEEIAHDTPPAEIEKRLNQLAKDSWDLAGIDPHAGGEGKSLYIFSRQAQRTEKPVRGFAEAQLTKSPKTENL